MTASQTFAVILLIISILGLAYAFMERKSRKEKKKLLDIYENEIEPLTDIHNEKTDLSKLGEEYGEKLRREEGIDINGKKLADGKPSASRNAGVKRRQEVPIPTPSVAGKNSNSRRKPGSNSKGIFRKFRRRKQ